MPIRLFMFDLSGRKPNEICLNYVDEPGRRKAVLDEYNNGKGIKIDSRTIAGLFGMLKKEGAVVLQIGALQIVLKEERTYTRIAVTRQGVETILKCCIPEGGVKDQTFYFTEEGEILLDRGSDDVRDGQPITLYPRPNQRLAIRRPNFKKDKEN